jgi:hypothetical protein
VVPIKMASASPVRIVAGPNCCGQPSRMTGHKG